MPVVVDAETQLINHSRPRPMLLSLPGSSCMTTPSAHPLPRCMDRAIFFANAKNSSLIKNMCIRVRNGEWGESHDSLARGFSPTKHVRQGQEPDPAWAKLCLSQSFSHNISLPPFFAELQFQLQLTPAEDKHHSNVCQHRYPPPR
jgi:hypothetical protein